MIPMAMARSAHVPILTGRDRSRAVAAVESIATALTTATVDVGSIASGSAGLALFFGYLSASDPETRHGELAQKWLAHAIDSPPPDEERLSFLKGITGVAWAADHLGIHLMRARDTFKDLDDAILDCVRETPWPGFFDAAQGLAGYGLLALDRLDRPLAHQIVEQVIDRFAETSLPLNHGSTWWTPPTVLPEDIRRQYPEGLFNLGLAHGLPCIIAFLAQVCERGVATNKARALLDRAVRWLMSQQNPDGSRSSFSSYAPLPGRSRSVVDPGVRWCYGDLGVSAGLFSAAQSVGEQSWAEDALRLARRVASRPIEGARVQDATICHGAAGNGHIFNRFYQATRDPIFLEAACRWLHHALSFYSPGRGCGGFQTRVRVQTEGDDAWLQLPGIFGGAAGIGLALLAAITPIEPAWDKIMMISMRPLPHPS